MATRKTSDALAHVPVIEDVERRVLRRQGIEYPTVVAEKPHIGCVRVPFMNSTIRSDPMSDSIRDFDDWSSCMAFSSGRASAEPAGTSGGLLVQASFVVDRMQAR